MSLYFRFLGIAVIFICGISCSPYTTRTEANNYRIDYSVGGGFTGIESGITITHDGRVRYWERKLNSLPTISDSLVLKTTQLNTLNNLMQNEIIFSYKNEYKGNYAAHMAFSNDIMNNNFSFNPSELPNDMPNVIKNIIAEIAHINKHK